MIDQNLSDQKVPNILIVDDVPENLKVLGAILEEEGYKVRPVLNGFMALQVAEKEKPDLILLDIMMPAMNGFDVCKRLKENPNLMDVPVIFISALNDTNDIVTALTCGGADFITKPFQAEEVKARITTHLKLYFQTRENEMQRQELQALNASKDKFFSIIAHDLRSPFNSFLGLTEIMRDHLSSLSMEEIHKIAGNLNNSASNLFRLLENLLQWSRVKTGSIPFNPEALSLWHVVKDSTLLVVDALRAKEIELSIGFSPGLTVYADDQMLQSVIRNLVSNAMKFTPAGGKIHLMAKIAETDFIELSVSDSGIGMSPEIIDQLFRIDSKISRKGTNGEPGSGLGLLLCREFTEKMGGTIRAESETGKGSAFIVTLPLFKG